MLETKRRVRIAGNQAHQGRCSWASDPVAMSVIERSSKMAPSGNPKMSYIGSGLLCVPAVTGLHGILTYNGVGGMAGVRQSD
jgi:hypothetical protein